MGAKERPKFADVLDLLELNVHVGLHVCKLGEVARYHKGPPARVDVQFQARPILRDGIRYDRPIVPRVPIAQWSFGPIVIRAVPEVGDAVVCHVFDREIATYLRSGGGTYNPSSRRSHSVNDIIAVPSIRTNRKDPKTTDQARTIYIGHESGSGDYIRINVQTGATEIVTKTSLKLGSATATLGVARMTDTVGPGTTMATWIAAITTAVNTLAPGSAIAPTDFGSIVSASTKVKSE